MTLTETVSGTVERFLFQSADNGFGVFVLRHKNNDNLIVRGYVAHITPGEVVTIQGTWVTHPKFGRQFEAHSCTAQVPTSLQGLQKYLSSGLIKGIGPVYAKKLVDHFGSDILTVIDEHPERLHTVPGIGTKRIETIRTAWQDQKVISHIMVFLQDKGVSPAYAVKMYKTYGQDTINKVIENPYRLAEDIWGIGFKIADSIAQNLDFAHDSIKRVKAGILFCITTALGNGHVYVELEDLRTQTMALLDLQSEHRHLLKCALHELHNETKITLVTHNNTHYITRTQYFYTEKAIATSISTLQSHISRHAFDIQHIYTKLRTGKYGTTQLSDDQQKGILTCLQNKVSVITGGPGTGKTTLIKNLLAILDEYQVSYKLAAPTGRAAKRMTESTGKQAATIHRLLEFDPHTYGFTRNEQNALAVDFLIVDEASMIDLFLAHAVCKALPHHAHLVLLGDVDQLPSVGPGSILKDIIASNKVSCIQLAHIFRQAQDSLIVTNAHRINNGEFPLSHRDEGKRDYIFFKEPDAQNAMDHITKVYTRILPQYGIAAHDAMVLAPMKRGVVGTQTLNHTIQQIVNTAQNVPHLMHAGYTYKVHDRVMQIKNNYDKNVFNGDIGTITAVDVQEKTLSINFDTKTLIYESHELDELMLAYAISIHKSQGSEFKAVIIPLFMQHFTLLQRNLLYTAITRAKLLCICIGQPKAIAVAVNNNKDQKRITFLQEQLTTGVTHR